MADALKLVPISLRDANALVERCHRHHGPARGCKFVIGLRSGADLVGAVIVGRPVSRMLDDGATLEVTRCVVREGVPNACSKLYAAAQRAAGAMGCRLITYTLEGESGASLRAAGWKCAGPAGGGSWSRAARPREDKAPTTRKQRWEARPP